MSFKSFSSKIFQGKDNKIKGSANDGDTADKQSKAGEKSDSSSKTTKNP